MKIMAFDSSGNVASVAILEDGILLAEYTVNHKKTHSQTLMGMMDEIVRMTECELSELSAIAVAGGPGSFTGLRIGAASVKGLAMALDIPVVSVPTMEAMAYNLWGNEAMLCPMMDARREQVYTGVYSFDAEGGLCIIEPQCAIAVEEIIEKLNLLGKRCVLLGDGVPPYIDIIKEKLTVPYVIAPANMNRQRAASVGVAAFNYIRQGKVETAAQHAPVYLRVSQAERERAMQQ